MQKGKRSLGTVCQGRKGDGISGMLGLYHHHCHCIWVNVIDDGNWWAKKGAAEGTGWCMEGSICKDTFFHHRPEKGQQKL